MMLTVTQGSSAILEPVAELAQLENMMRRFEPVELAVDTSGLSQGDRAALKDLLEAARVIDRIFLQQVWSGNLALHEKLKADETLLGRARLRYFWLNKGPWSDLDAHAAFLPDVPPRKPPGANFYPDDMTREEFEAWATDEARGFFSCIRRSGDGKLQTVPYSEAYRGDLERAAELLRRAAAATDNESLRRFLKLRAGAFLSNDYYESDLAWLDVDAPIDVTIGPYETYNDEIFGYKAGFEAYIALRDEAETAKLRFFGDHLQEVEDNLPIDARYRNPKLGGQAPIRVVNEIYAAGDGSHGVKTAAFNLPNDERVIREKGCKRVMLKNVQQAKFDRILLPIARRVLGQEAQENVRFDSFFTHILAHELSHGIGPHEIRTDGRQSTPRLELKELYSPLEEAKADVLGLYMLQFLYDRGLLGKTASSEADLYTTFLASSFRSMRFGIEEAHGKGMAVQFNWLLDRGAFFERPDGKYLVDVENTKSAVRGLAHEVLMIEATGDYEGAARLLQALGVVRPGLRRTLDELQDLPTDICPITPAIA